jgi:hypothetical protein
MKLATGTVCPPLFLTVGVSNIEPRWDWGRTPMYFCPRCSIRVCSGTDSCIDKSLESRLVSKTSAITYELLLQRDFVKLELVGASFGSAKQHGCRQQSALHFDLMGMLSGKGEIS